jgi:hypothetical protein
MIPVKHKRAAATIALFMGGVWTDWKVLRRLKRTS